MHYALSKVASSARTSKFSAHSGVHVFGPTMLTMPNRNRHVKKWLLEMMVLEKWRSNNMSGIVTCRTYQGSLSQLSSVRWIILNKTMKGDMQTSIVPHRRPKHVYKLTYVQKLWLSLELPQDTPKTPNDHQTIHEMSKPCPNNVKKKHVPMIT